MSQTSTKSAGGNMPVATTVLENGRVVRFEITDPWVAQDLNKAHYSMRSYYESAPLPIHTLVDVTKTRVLPPNAISARSTSPALRLKHGLLAIVGATNLVETVANVSFQLLHYHKAKFFKTEESALTYLRDAIAKEPVYDKVSQAQ